MFIVVRNDGTSSSYWSQADFCRDANLKPSTVSNWLKGRLKSYTKYNIKCFITNGVKSDPNEPVPKDDLVVFPLWYDENGNLK